MLLLVAIALVAQDSTTTGAVNTGSWISNNYMLIAGLIYALYEVIVRYFPTVSNISILSWVIKLIQFLVPNNSVTGGTHEKSN